MKKRYVHAFAAVVVLSALAVAATAAVGGTTEPAGDREAASSSSITTHPTSVQGMRQPLPPIARVQVQDVPGAALSESVLAFESRLKSVYLTPTTGGVCISLVRVGLGAGLTCGNRPATLLEGCHSHAVNAAPTCERATVYGIAPDGVDRVAVTAQDGVTIESEKVTNGVYLLDVALNNAPRTLEFDLEGDQVREPLPFVGMAN